METKASKEQIKINRTLIISWITIIAILLVAYLIEVVKGERTLTYIFVFSATMLVPLLISGIIFHRRPNWNKFGYVVVFGYSVMYAFVLFTGNTQMVSMYILPVLCFLVLYHDLKLIVTSFGVTSVINVVSLLYMINHNAVTVSNSKEIEIRFAVIIVSYAGAFVSTRLLAMIYKENDKHEAEIMVRNREIQDMALQTIATIANTIDAKDEYTRGHSRRVSEYSAALATEMGYPEEDINRIRSIALLHDIGKIGVPDSVLNKPGRLTDAEYEIMKQHTVMGSEILKDIKMLPGIDIGARYHHERYDGKGYPDHLAGDEIPELSRIIAVADAFDAMTSNRVYRKHLDMDRVLEELKKCSGTQFDPMIASMLIRLIEQGRIDIPSPDAEEEVSEVSKIWSRILQTGEHKLQDNSQIDDLTGLFTRNVGEKLIREAVETHKGVLIAVDADKFRRVNRKAGFLLGDIFLRIVSKNMQEIPVERKVISRFGSDEFVIFVSDLVDRAEIEAIIGNMLENIRTQGREVCDTVDLTVSIGIRVCENDKNIYQDMFLDSDRALYLSKQKGGDCYTFYEKENNGQGDNTKESVDLIRLRDSITGKVVNNAAYQAATDEFKNAYDLISKLLSEPNQPLQLVLFTAKTSEGVNVPIEKHNQVLEYLEKAISRSIKGKDFTFRYSSAQRMVVLTNTHEDGARAASMNVMREFYKFYTEKDVTVSYSMIEIS